MSAAIHIRNRVAGFYTFHKGKVDADGIPIPGTYEKVAEFQNLITNNGLDSIWTCPGGSFGIQYLARTCLVGTGNTAPAFTDTTLDVYLASASTEDATNSFVDDVSEPYWKFVRVYRFNAGTATGNLAEVGTGWATNDLLSRALILDGGGVPTTITVLADEYLDVTFEFRNYIDPASYTGTISISGTPYDIEWRPALIGTVVAVDKAINTTGAMQVAATQTLGTIYQQPSSLGSNQTVDSYSTYVSGDYFIDMTFEWGLSSGNLTGGIGSALFTTGQSRFQISFDPKIPKTNTDILTLTFRVSWARH